MPINQLDISIACWPSESRFGSFALGKRCGVLERKSDLSTDEWGDLVCRIYNWSAWTSRLEKTFCPLICMCVVVVVQIG